MQPGTHARPAQPSAPRTILSPGTVPVLLVPGKADKAPRRRAGPASAGQEPSPPPGRHGLRRATGPSAPVSTLHGPNQVFTANSIFQSRRDRPFRPQLPAAPLARPAAGGRLLPAGAPGLPAARRGRGRAGLKAERGPGRRRTGQGLPAFTAARPGGSPRPRHPPSVPCRPSPTPRGGGGSAALTGRLRPRPAPEARPGPALRTRVARPAPRAARAGPRPAAAPAPSNGPASRRTGLGRGQRPLASPPRPAPPPRQPQTPPDHHPPPPPRHPPCHPSQTPTPSTPDTPTLSPLHHPLPRHSHPITPPHPCHPPRHQPRHPHPVTSTHPHAITPPVLPQSPLQASPPPPVGSPRPPSIPLPHRPPSFPLPATPAGRDQPPQTPPSTPAPAGGPEGQQCSAWGTRIPHLGGSPCRDGHPPAANPLTHRSRAGPAERPPAPRGPQKIFLRCFWPFWVARGLPARTAPWPSRVPRRPLGGNADTRGTRKDGRQQAGFGLIKNPTNDTGEAQPLATPR